MMRISLTALTRNGPRDVVAQADDTVTAGRFAEVLGESLGEPRAQVVAHPAWASGPLHQRAGHLGGLWVNGRPVDPSTPAGQVLRDGDIVAFDPAAAAATHRGEPSGAVELRVSSGPAAGAVHRLGFGTYSVGTSPGCSVQLPDQNTGPHAFSVHVTVHEAMVEPAPGAFVLLEGRQLAGPERWTPGQVLITGASVLTLMLPENPDAHLTPIESGLAYNRPPRLSQPPRTKPIEVPIEPQRPTHQRLQLLTSVLFGVGGVVMAIAFNQPLFLLMALLTPLTMVGQWYSDRRHGKRSHKQALKEFRLKRDTFAQALELLRLDDQAERRAQLPDPAETLLTATGPRRRLWERRSHDADTLHLRVGVADQTSLIELIVEHGSNASNRELPSVPVSHAVPLAVPMPQVGVLGLTGARQTSRALGRWLVAQAAALHSPRDLAIVVLSADHEGEASWNWVRWLPHAAPHEGEECLSLVGADPESAARRAVELVNKIQARRASKKSNMDFGGFGGLNEDKRAFAGYASEKPYDILVVLDGARALRSLPGMPQILQFGPTVGVYSICIDDDQRLLPEECTTVAVCDLDRPAFVRLSGAMQSAEVIADQVNSPWCDRFGRALAPLRDVSREDADSAIPTSARLLDLLGMPDPAPEQIASYWSRGRTTRVPIGIGADGLYTLDLRLDGPHGLVAGTTGAGKSELLQSFIASLAVHNRPDEMNFVLIDYKGGSAFKDCAKLPHTVGMVSDLDGHLTERALESLAAELKRREHMLLRADAKDVEDYNDYRDQGMALEPMPRLILIIDEFAAMVQELPDFIVGLVDIARRGRSLGVHLILATQRPGGVVTPDIAANTNLRIALRVTSNEESADVINAPVAAQISKTTPGRCYVRSGAASLHAVQSARIGGRRPGQGKAKTEFIDISPITWIRLGSPLDSRAQAEDESLMETDLSVLVEVIGRTARAMGVSQQRSPWLEPLADTLTLAELEPADTWTKLPLGLADVPSLQMRSTEVYDLAASGHLLVCGSARSGRSTVLRALAASVAVQAPPRDVHLYAVDCGNNALLPLVGLPHTGAVVGRDSPDRLTRLTDRLLGEIARRQQLLAGQGFADLSEQRAAVPEHERLPYLLVLFDRWEGFYAAFESYDGGKLVDQWLQILQEGAGVGVKVVMSGDRTTLVGRISTLFDDRLVLKLSDPADYSYVGMRAKDVPDHMPPGRGFRAATVVREVQVGLLAADVAGTAQVAALHQLGREAKLRFGELARHLRPFRVDALPTGITLAEAVAMADEALPSDAVVFGVGGDSLGLRAFRADEHGPALVVAGPPKSGRSTTLVTMGTWLAQRGYTLVTITPRRSPVRDLPGASFGGEASPDEVRQALSGKHALLVDDLELLGNDSELAEWLTDYVSEVRDTGNLVIGAGSVEDLDSMYRGPVVAMKKARNGLLLRPTSTSQGDLLGVRLPRSLATGSGPAGRGLMVLGGTWELVQVASA
ncbi:FtsK/SpoIIIE domain-containing protein [Nonomuraea soli]|uniref:S-DNA-T family DNA segregation ATPase FtsK/SpoIIIE n=1 Tax=Nonomuraea soli TaxID=1032476 RepID=A0A7W0CJV5_9ACTN|nr:FtsK/SpoIIIE domain-containing protein [Nonomuraea soli]MBA2892501.1 S-DNA-T family DNA segregation ATPase FtsK/SpoIIIE [Nonomuraea soli]